MDSIAVTSLSREDTGPSRFGTMMDDYRDILAVLKGRDRALPGCFELVY
jgi:hypothetical protein